MGGLIKAELSPQADSNHAWLLTVLPIAVALAVLTVSMVAAVGIGSVRIPIASVIQVLQEHAGIGVASPDRVAESIVWQLRLPRVLGAAATGAGLALAGCVLQSLTRNELADPYLLGISGGASVAAVTVLVFGVSLGGLIAASTLTIGAFLGAMAALIGVLLLATTRTGDLPPGRTILAGIAVGQVCAAYTAFVVIVSGDQNAARRVLDWTMGSLAGLRWESALFLVTIVLVTLAVILTFHADLDAFAFGESAASSLGVRVNRVRWVMMIGTAFATGCLVAFTGVIGFVGLVIPHAMRLLIGPVHRMLLPLSALGGSILLVWADAVARSLFEGQEIPVGVVTAAVGAPVFAYLLRRQAR